MTSPNDETRDPSAEPTDEEMEVELETFDLNDDGKVSFVEDLRAELGVVDARLEELAEEPGIKGKLAEGAHKLLDKLDND